MITISGIELDFDTTAPEDILRFKEAYEAMVEESKGITGPTLSEGDPAFLDAYVEMLNKELRLFGNFIDGIFGDGIAEQLLGNKPSLRKVNAVMDEMGDVLQKDGEEYGLSLKKYQPNRATRRAQAKN